jgi:hypothetical protein
MGQYFDAQVAAWTALQPLIQAMYDDVQAGLAADAALPANQQMDPVLRKRLINLCTLWKQLMGQV